jgi:hypothetical protein
VARLAHRRVDFDLVAAAEPLRAGFEAKGWRASRLLWMRHETAPAPGPNVPVEEVPYDVVHELRVAWHREEFPDQDPGSYHAQAREVALRRDVTVLAVREAGLPVAFAQLERDGAAAEITQVSVRLGASDSPHPDLLAVSPRAQVQPATNAIACPGARKDRVTARSSGVSPRVAYRPLLLFVRSGSAARARTPAGSRASGGFWAGHGPPVGSRRVLRRTAR